ncbi:MAG: hypothetical protein ACTSVB_06705, partial [Candidatus Heimdallarchaeaceae archaeon]
MKLMKLLPITILVLVLTVTLVRATHIPEVLLNPSEWTANTLKELSLSVKNVNGDNIVRVEIEVPETADGVPVYKIGDIITPGGWEYSIASRGEFIKRIIWKTSGTGIGVGETKEFGFEATSPESGEYTWNWKTTDVNGDVFSGSSTTKVSTAPVAYFKIFGVPEKIMAGSLL